jgi:predicted DNA-binding protein (UPF0251 family)
MSKKDIKKLSEVLNQNIEIEVESKDPNKPPFIYYLEISDGIIKWTCDYAPEGTLHSVEEFIPHQQDQAKQYVEFELEDLEEAIRIKDQKIENGWKKTYVPKYEFNMDEKPLNRKQRRAFAKMLLSGKIPEGKKPEEKEESILPKKEIAPSWKYSDEELSEDS